MFLLNSFYRYLMTQKTIFVYLLSSTFIFVFFLFIIVISIVFLLQQIINIDKYYCSTVRGITSVVAMKCRAKFVILFIYFILCKYLPYSQYTWLLYISQTILRVHVAICTKKSTFLYCAPLFWRHNSKIIICFFIFYLFFIPIYPTFSIRLSIYSIATGGDALRDILNLPISRRVDE